MTSSRTGYLMIATILSAGFQRFDLWFALLVAYLFSMLYDVYKEEGLGL